MPLSGSTTTDRLLIAGDLDGITCDVTTSVSTFRQAMEYLLENSDLTLGLVDPDFADELVSIYIDQQIKTKELIDQILASIDACKIIEFGVMSIESRKTFSMDFFETEIDHEIDIIGEINIGDELPKYHKYEAVYQQNHTVQPNVIAYRQPGLLAEQYDAQVEFEDYPTNSIKSGSLERSVVLPFIGSAISNKILAKQARDALRRLPLDFQIENRQWTIQRNSRVKLTSHLLPPGMFVPEDVIEETGSTITTIMGVYYVAQ